VDEAYKENCSSPVKKHSLPIERTKMSSRELSHARYFQEEQMMEFEAELQGFPGGPYDLSLLSKFGKHVTCRLWIDHEVSIIV